MDFYLVRHGDAKREYEDPQRSLSDRGKREVEEVARALAGKQVKASKILHSGKLRAKQTAEILAQALSPEAGVQESQGLSPEDDPLVIKAELEVSGEPLIIVGHLPHLDRLTGILLTGNPEKQIVEFPPAGVACLSREEHGWKLKLTLAPQRQQN